MTHLSATVRSVESVTPGMTRICFAGEDLRGIADAGPDQYVKIFFPLPGQRRPRLPEPPAGDAASWYRVYLAMPDDVRPPMRTYTIRSLRAERGEVDVDFALHGDNGPASRWARAAEPGDEVALLGPHGLYAAPGDCAWQLLIGDETAVPAIGAIVEKLAPGSVARVLVEVSGDAERQRFESRGDVEIQWVPRGSAPHGRRVLEALRAADLPDGAPYAWVSGEAGLVKHARRHLVADRGVDKRAITFTGYWRRGRSEEEVGRESLARADRGETPDDD
ncbi:siderophore-interacting protein [Spinactinospora alkalitolerans]